MVELFIAVAPLSVGKNQVKVSMITTRTPIMYSKALSTSMLITLFFRCAAPGWCFARSEVYIYWVSPVNIMLKVGLSKSIPKAHYHRSEQQDHVLAAAYLNSGHITYRQQGEFKNEQSFFRAMQKLIIQNILEERELNVFSLTTNGIFYVKHVVLK